MAQWDLRDIKCSSNEAIAVCSQIYLDILTLRITPCGKRIVDRQQATETTHRYFNSKIKEISNKYSDLNIICEYSFTIDETEEAAGADFFSEIHTVEYHNGIDKVINIEKEPDLIFQEPVNDLPV